MTSGAKFLSRSVRISGVFDVVVVLALSATWLGLLGDLWWFFDLFAHFRLQYLGVCIAGLPWFLWRKSRMGTAISCASLLLNGALVFGSGAGSPAGKAGAAFHLRAVSINVHTSNHAADKVLEFIRRADADVVFLIEVDRWWEKELAPLKQMYPHSLIESREDNFGVAFFSRVEVIKSEVDVFGDAGVPTVTATLKHAGRTFRFMGAHPLPPTGRENSEWRNEDLTAIAENVAKGKEPVLLMGDLNATPWSAGMRFLTRKSNLRLPASKFAWSPTWMVATPLAIPIDHALATAPLVVLRREVGPDVGSDHRPIIADVGWIQ